MKKRLLTTLAALAITGCSVNSHNGMNVSNLDNVDFTKEFKTGKACETRFLIFGPFGDASIVKAAKSGGIKKIDLVEYKRTGYIFVANRCAIVHGE